MQRERICCKSIGYIQASERGRIIYVLQKTMPCTTILGLRIQSVEVYESKLVLQESGVQLNTRN